MSTWHQPGGCTAAAVSSPVTARRRAALLARAALDVGAVALALAALPAFGQARDLIGFNRLQAELGTAMPTGAGVPVGQVEAYDGSGFYPSIDLAPTTGSFAGKHFTLIQGSGESAPTLSGHGQFVGQNYYGNDISMAPGVSNIYAYSITGWYQTILHGGETMVPSTTPARVVNHSYLDSTLLVGRFDWLVDTDDSIQVVAVNNADSTTTGSGNGGLPSAMNTIGVGRSDGVNVTGTESAGGIYTAGRPAIMLVAPGGATSFAAPMVAGAAATLVAFAHGSPTLSHDSYISPRTGNRIYAGETSEVIKATLMAGASRKSIPTYAVDTANGLSSVFGAGQLNLYDSYQILHAGEQSSAEHGNTRSIHRSGFDYEPAMTDGGSATYYFTGDLARRGILATLVVNAKVADPTINDPSLVGATLRSLGLSLYDLATPDAPVAQVQDAADSTQTLSFSNLLRGHHYMLKVTPAAGQGIFTQDYGLAWRFTPSSVITSAFNNGVADLFYGDLNGNRMVDTQDFGMFSTNFGRLDGTWSDGDMNGDGVVDTLDFGLFARNFGGILPTTALSAAELPQRFGATPRGATAFESGTLPGGAVVPEPGSGMLALAISFACSCTRARRRIEA